MCGHTATMTASRLRLLVRTSTFRAALALAVSMLALVAPIGIHAESSNTITVLTGQSLILATPRLTRVAVGDGKIAGIVPIGTDEILVNGKSAGSTTLFVWTKAGRRNYIVTVTQRDLDDLRRMVTSAITAPGVRVEQFERSLIVTGSAANGDDLIQIAEIVSRFTPLATAGNYTIANAVTVQRPLGQIQDLFASKSATAGVVVERDARGGIIVSGLVPDRTTAEAVLAKVNALGGQYLTKDGKVIDRLQTETTSQVDVKVYVLEIDDTGLQQLGISLQAATFLPTAGGPPAVSLGQPVFPVVEAALGLGKALTLGAFFRTATLAPTLNLIVTSGHAKILSSPNLVMLPGRKAEFLVGGEIPIPVASGPGQISIQYKEFGVRLAVTSTILGNGDIQTTISPEVSDLDFTDGITLNGFVVPALKTSKLSTDVVTKSGESIVMGGLVKRVEQRTVNKIPFLGDLPILGKLFRSTTYQTRQSDVVFIMTPTILSR
jgi:pilus assembly protein CpaC